MEKLLITGASGLLGKSILRKIITYNEYDVYAVTTNTDKLKSFENVNVIQSNLADRNERQKLISDVNPDIIIHLAWNQKKSDFRNSDTNLQWLNISIDLLELFHKNKGKYFIFAGSSSEYDGSCGTFSETDDVVPKSLYGLCKKTFSEFGMNYFKDSNFKFLSTRLFTIYGPEDSHSFGAIPYIIRCIRNNEKIICKSPNTTRDYIYSDDAAEIIINLMKKNISGIINVASGKPQSMKEVFKTITEIYSKQKLLDINTENTQEDILNADISLLLSTGCYKNSAVFYDIIKKEYFEKEDFR